MSALPERESLERVGAVVAGVQPRRFARILSVTRELERSGVPVEDIPRRLAEANSFEQRELETQGLRLDLEGALPAELARACRAIAEWVQIAPEVVVTSLMAHASAAIGNTTWVTVRGREVPLSLHYVTSVPSGSGKSEVRRYMRGATDGIERDVLARRERAARSAEDYQLALAAWRKARQSLSAKTRDGAGERPPEPPEPNPLGGPRVTYAFSESTLEGVVATLQDTPRGAVWMTDEAAELVGMLGAYDDGRRALDAARLRKLTESQPVEAHRARANAEPIRRLRRPWLALDADVQPGVLAKLFRNEDRVSGLTARLLVHEPPPMQGSREYVSPPPLPGPEILGLLRARMNELWSIQLELDEEGVPRFFPLPLTAEAERTWAAELERLEGLYHEANEAIEGALGHARGRLLRLAGVLALLRDPRATAVATEDMHRSIVHMRYHLAHAEKLLGGSANGSQKQREQREIVELARRRNGSLSARELVQGSRRYRDGGVKCAETALGELVKLGRGRWEVGPRGGRRFLLEEPVNANTTTRANTENSDGVDVDGPDVVPQGDNNGQQP